MSETFQLPLDWNTWQGEWETWKRTHRHVLKQTTHRFEGRNFLADENLGTWEIRGRVVELSEVTFPSFERDAQTGRLKNDEVRGIGVTFMYKQGEGEPTVVHSFTELEQVLGL